MTKTLLKNTFREIANSKARFISILAIIALGVGFFAGIKATVPSMYNMADEYYSQSNLMDYRLVSTVGFDKDDVKAVENLDNVTDVMPSYFADLVLKSNGNGGNGKVIRVTAAPKSYNNNKTLNTLNIKEGRLPEKKGEILVEYGSVGSSDYKIGDKVVFGSESGESNALDMVDTLEYTVVGKAESPMYISYQRGSTTIGNGNIEAFMYIYQDDFVTERYTEMYVKTAFSDGDGSAFDDEYEKDIESFTTVLENTADLRCEAFDKDVIGKAKQELEDSKNDYETEKSEALTKLDDAKTTLHNSEKEYTDKINYGKSPLEYLKENRGFIKEKGGEIQISSAAILLFGKNPQNFFPRARIRFIRYEGTEEKFGTEMNVIKDVIFDGTLLNMINEAIAYLDTQVKEKTY